MQNIQKMNNILSAFKIQAECVEYYQLDNYSYFDLFLFHGTKIRDITKFSDEISLALKSYSKPRVNVLHNQGLVRLEFASPREKMLRFFDIFDGNLSHGRVPCQLGQLINGSILTMDLSKNPHMIIAGTTGSGKSTLLHNIIANILLSRKTILCLLDPKGIEFVEYSRIPGIQVGYSLKEGINVLDELLDAMEYRYSLLRQGIDISNYPNAVLIIDEFADLIMQDKSSEFYNKLCRLAQKCRAANISIILSTQRPSVNIIDGTIKANFPARIACRTASQIDSRVILDSNGAENLLGHGDALIKDNSRFLERFQVAYTDAKEVVNHILCQ